MEYQPVQKKNSSWTPTPVQKKGKSPGKMGHSSIQPKSNPSSAPSPEIREYSRASADRLAANVMRGIQAKKQEEAEGSTLQRKSESPWAPTFEPPPPLPQSPASQLKGAFAPVSENPIQRQCTDCANQEEEQAGEAGKDLKEIGIQTKLTVGAPGDAYEQEADLVETLHATSLQVMSMSSPPDSSASVQRQLDTNHPHHPKQIWQRAQSIKPVVHRQIDPRVQMRQMIQRAHQIDGNQASGDLESRLNTSKGGGSPLSEGVRGFMEPRFGADFSGVRVHTGGEAVQINQELGAQAFTHGSDVYFGAGKSPGNNELTAHELTHVVQQSGKAVQRQSVFSKSGKESHPEEGEQEQLQAKELSSHISGETLNKELRLQAEQLGQTQTVERSQIAEEEKLLKQLLGEAEEKAVQIKEIQQRSSLNEITIASSRNAEQKTGNEGTDRLACFGDQNHNMTVVWTLIANPGDRISSYQIWLRFRDGQGRSIPRAPLRARRVLTDQITIHYTQSANIGRVSLTGEAWVGNRETGVRRVSLLPLETYCSFKDNNPNSQENPPQNLPIIWPRWAGLGLPTRSQSRPNVDKVYVGKRLTRTRPGRRDQNLPNQFRRQYNISDGQAVHHLIPLFLGGQDRIENLVGVWGRNHTRGHSALREQAQLTNYGVSSTDLYQHPIGTTYRVAAIS